MVKPIHGLFALASTASSEEAAVGARGSCLPCCCRRVGLLSPFFITFRAPDQPLSYYNHGHFETNPEYLWVRRFFYRK